MKNKERGSFKNAKIEVQIMNRVESQIKITKELEAHIELRNEQKK